MPNIMLWIDFSQYYCIVVVKQNKAQHALEFLIDQTESKLHVKPAGLLILNLQVHACIIQTQIDAFQFLLAT